MRIQRHVFLAGLLVATAATTDDTPDPAAVNAGEANLEPIAQRQGLAFTLAIGGAVTLGFGINDSTGTGGSGVLRLAHVATPRSLITLISRRAEPLGKCTNCQRARCDREGRRGQSTPAGKALARPRCAT